MTKVSLLLRLIVAVLAGLLLFFSGAWGALALWYQLPGRRPLKGLGSVLWMALVLSLQVWTIVSRSAWPWLAYAAALVTLLLWWRSIRPSNDRDWADDVARLLHGAVDHGEATLHNVRNFHWRSDDDYDVRWETRRYALDRLVRADAILSYWSGRAIAHAMISFGFDDGQHLVFSVEIRRKRGEEFSSIGGFFKQFEMVLVAADETDIVRVRTNVRGEDDYLFPLSMERATLRSLLTAYVDAANELARHPRWYNSITSNCTTLVYRMGKRLDPGLPMDLRLLLTGYLPSYFYDTHTLDHRLSLEEWARRGHFTQRARECGAADDFSRVIRDPSKSPDHQIKSSGTSN